LWAIRDDLLERALQGFVISIRADFLGGFDEPLRLLWIVRFCGLARHGFDHISIAGKIEII